MCQGWTPSLIQPQKTSSFNRRVVVLKSHIQGPLQSSVIDLDTSHSCDLHLCADYVPHQRSEALPGLLHAHRWHEVRPAAHAPQLVHMLLWPCI